MRIKLDKLDGFSCRFYLRTYNTSYLGYDYNLLNCVHFDFL